jgi:cation diffusion facilitator CzcD-associated flavoprotein CzcO
VRIAVIGAGAAGLTSAKQALELGHDAVVFERHQAIGGIWNPRSGGAYPGVRMQTSKMSFPFSDFAPQPSTSEFVSVGEMQSYLIGYASHYGVGPRIRYRNKVTGVAKVDGRWTVEAETPTGRSSDQFDAVMVATGELWRPLMPRSSGPVGRSRILSAKQYGGPAAFRGLKTLVVGGGVSGADIAAELSGTAASVDWAVRRKWLFLPRRCGGMNNDEMFSYVGRRAADELDRGAFLDVLHDVVPEHMEACAQAGLLPGGEAHNHAVHINDDIVRAVASRAVRLREAFSGFETDGSTMFEGGDRGNYDAILFCMGYDTPDYGFIQGFRHRDLYEHFIYRRDPSLAIVNTPVDAEGFGTACPYFEAIAGWVLRTFTGEAGLPGADEMADWCDTHMRSLDRKRFYDCWLETIRLRLASGTMPDPNHRFADYWTIVSSQVAPANLGLGTPRAISAPCDEMFDMKGLKARILASLPRSALSRLRSDGQLDADDCERACALSGSMLISPGLAPRDERGLPPAAGMPAGLLHAIGQ